MPFDCDFARPMRKRRVIWFGAVLFCLLQSVFGQAFLNLDFEHATIPPTIGPRGALYPADPAQTFPGWTVGAGTVVGYNSFSIGAPAVSLIGPNFPNFTGYIPLEGSYSVLFQYFADPGLSPPTLSQIGLVPATAQSINFLVSSNLHDAALSLNGVSISLIPIAGGRMSGDITAFAGNVAQIKFSTLGNIGPGNWFYLDDIRFSASPVPEPSTFSLFGFCMLLLYSLRKRKNDGLGGFKLCRDPIVPALRTRVVIWLR